MLVYPFLQIVEAFGLLSSDQARLVQASRACFGGASLMNQPHSRHVKPVGNKETKKPACKKLYIFGLHLLIKPCGLKPLLYSGISEFVNLPTLKVLLSEGILKILNSILREGFCSEFLSGNWILV